MKARGVIRKITADLDMTGEEAMGLVVKIDGVKAIDLLLTADGGWEAVIGGAHAGKGSSARNAIVRALQELQRAEDAKPDEAATP